MRLASLARDLRLGCALAAGLSAAGCAPDAGALGWRLTFAAGVPRERVRRVRARILRGTCESSLVLYEAQLPPGATDAPRPPELGAGRFAFEGVVTDASCGVLATGCAELELPREGSVEIVLRSVTPPRALCPITECADGVCGAPRDGGVDLGPPDTGPPDSGPPDSGPPDTGPPPVDGGSPRIPIARVAKVFRVMSVNWFRVAFTDQPGGPTAPTGAVLEDAHFWALPPPCRAGSVALHAFYAPEPGDPSHAFYTTRTTGPMGYVEAPVFACVPAAAGPGTTEIRQLSWPGAPAAAYYYTADPGEASEIAASGYGDDGVAFLGWAGP